MSKLDKGQIHIYCGDGKGKTSAVIGLCVRAAGNGLKVLMIQFLKAGTSGEIKILSGIRNVKVIKGPEIMKFTHEMSVEEKEQLLKKNIADFAEIVKIAGQYDVLVLDEIIYAIAARLFPEKLLLEFLEHKPEHLEVVLSGQNPSKKLINLADYVSMIKKIKHPYDAGIKSRSGIES